MSQLDNFECWQLEVNLKNEIFLYSSLQELLKCISWNIDIFQDTNIKIKKIIKNRKDIENAFFDEKNLSVENLGFKCTK